MCTSISLVLFVVIASIGIVNVRLQQTKPLFDLSGPSQDRPIMDPDDGSGRSFEQDKPRIDRFANEMKEKLSGRVHNRIRWVNELQE